MKIIGLTGGIASGKSTVSCYLRALGVPVFDADAVSRACVKKGTRGLAKVLAALGQEYATESGELNRPKVAALVFRDDVARRKLEAIIHAEVLAAQQDFLAAQRAADVRVAVLDVPLLIETGWYKDCDEVWVVSLPAEEQVRRAMLRDGSTRTEVEARMAKQMSLAEKARYATCILDNSGTPERTRAQVAAQLEKL